MSDKYNWEDWGNTALSNGISRLTYNYRRRKGWSAKEAATTRKGQAKDKHGWYKWKYTAMKYGVSQENFKKRRRLGWSAEKAATTNEKQTKDKYGWHEWKDVACVDKELFRNRRAKGWSAEEAATTPKHTAIASIDEHGNLLNQYQSKYHAVYKNRDCVFIGTQSECEEFLGMEYRTELGEFRIDDNTIVFDIELEPNDELLEETI